jgi:hypothetical protein
MRLSSALPFLALAVSAPAYALEGGNGAQLLVILTYLSFFILLPLAVIVLLARAAGLFRAPKESQAVPVEFTPESDAAAPPSLQDSATEKRAALRLALGILLFPYIFAWFLLRPGYSLAARFIGFGWLAWCIPHLFNALMP